MYCTTFGFGEDLWVKGMHGMMIQADQIFSDAIEQYDEVVLPGGRSNEAALPRRLLSERVAGRVRKRSRLRPPFYFRTRPPRSTTKEAALNRRLISVGERRPPPPTKAA